MSVNLSFSNNDEEFSAIHHHNAVTVMLSKALPGDFPSSPSRLHHLKHQPRPHGHRRCSEGNISLGDLRQAVKKLNALSHVHQPVTTTPLTSPPISSVANNFVTVDSQSKTLPRILKASNYCNTNNHEAGKANFEDSSGIKIVLESPSSEALDKDTIQGSYTENSDYYSLPNSPSIAKHGRNNGVKRELDFKYQSVNLSPRKNSVPNTLLPKPNNTYNSSEKSRSLPRHFTPPPVSGLVPRQRRITSVSHPPISRNSNSSPAFDQSFGNNLNTSEGIVRSKSLLQKSSPFLRRSPTLSKRTSPYRELEGIEASSSSETEKVTPPPPEEVISHLPPKSPATRGDFPTEVRSTHKRSKSQGLTRKQRSSVSWKPVHEMMTNHQYEGHYHNDTPEEVGGTENDGSMRVPRMKSFDAVVFDVLKVSPEEFARQLTLLDFPIFCEIKPDELSSCGWTKKAKWKISPNVCALTQRFNHTSFWVIREILNAGSAKARAEVLTHFIKIAKKLLELSNLHSLMAVVQSLNSASIFRLSKTWALVNKHYKTQFDRLLALVREDDNRWELRSHMDAIKLPCVPFLGMYLSDIMYINSAHPDTGGLESHERTNKMNNVLRVLSEFQQSNYDHLQEQPHIKNYLNSVKYIEELQKFLEEDNYKLSQKIEPTQTSASLATPERKTNKSKDDSSTGKHSKMDASLNRHHLHHQVVATTPSHQRFVPGHRKSRSLGKEFNFTSSSSSSSSGGRPKSDGSSKIHKRRSIHGRVKQERDSTVWYISPTRFSPNRVQSSGSLPRTTAPTHTPMSVTTSLLDDSIIAMTSSSLASSSSSNTRMSVTTGNNSSIGSSRSNSGSEFSEQDEMSWSNDRDRTKESSYTCRTGIPQPKSKRISEAWCRRYHGNRGKFTYARTKPVGGLTNKSRTLPSNLSQAHAWHKPLVPVAVGQVAARPSTSFSDLDEFARLRCADDASTTKAEARKSSFVAHSLAAIPNDGGYGKLAGGSDGCGKFSGGSKVFLQYFQSPKLAISCQSRLDSAASKFGIPGTKFGGYETFKDSPSTKAMFPYRTSDMSMDFQTCNFEGVLRRKCVMKHGRKPTMSPWTKYWISLCGTQLVYYSAKGLRAQERHHFKARPSKAVSIKDWMLLYSEDPSRLDCFQLSNPDSGNIYRFQCDSKDVALVWLSNLKEAVKGYPQPEKDLINLEDT